MTKRRPDHAFSARQGRHIEAAAIFDGALGASTTSRPVAAAQLEISTTDLARICDPTTGRAVPLEHVLGLPDDAYRVVLGALAERADLAVVSLPSAASTGDDFRTLAMAQRESADVVSRGLEALADGRMCSREGAEIETECDQAIAALLAIRERARLAQREGVIGLVRKSGGVA